MTYSGMATEAERESKENKERVTGVELTILAD